MNALASYLRFVGPLLILFWVAFSALKLGPKVRTEPMPPAWVPVVREKVVPSPSKPPSLPSPEPEQPIKGAILEGSTEVETAHSLGDPVYITLTAVNTGEVSLTDVVIWLPLPAGINTVEGARFLRFTKKQLQPGERFRKKGTLVPMKAGKAVLNPRFVSNESLDVLISNTLNISTAVLTLEPTLGVARIAEGEGEACFTVVNHGGAPARDLIVRLPDLSEELLFWKELLPGASVEACFDLSTLQKGVHDLVVEASAYAADIAHYKNRLVVE